MYFAFLSFTFLSLSEKLILILSTGTIWHKFHSLLIILWNWILCSTCWSIYITPFFGKCTNYILTSLTNSWSMLHFYFKTWLTCSHLIDGEISQQPKHISQLCFCGLIKPTSWCLSLLFIFSILLSISKFWVLIYIKTDTVTNNLMVMGRPGQIGKTIDHFQEYHNMLCLSSKILQ